MARIIEPTSGQGSLRVLAEVGVDSVLCPMLDRHLRGYSAQDFRRELATACARHAKLGPASLVLNEVSTCCVSRPTPATVPRARVLQ